MLDTYVTGRLNHWADCTMRRQDSGLGYPKKVPYTEPSLPRGDIDDYVPEINEEYFDTDKSVCALRVENEDLYAVLILFYLKPNMVFEQKLKYLGCCKQTYYNKVARANNMILGYLNDIAAGNKLPSVDLNLQHNRKIA